MSEERLTRMRHSMTHAERQQYDRWIEVVKEERPTIRQRMYLAESAKAGRREVNWTEYKSLRPTREKKEVAK